MYNQLIQLVVKRLAQRFKRWEKDAAALQQHQLKQLIKGGEKTHFGLQHSFSGIRSYADFCKNIPIRDYSYFEPFVNQIIKGDKDVLWPGRPIYFAKTSGTTSGAKYIPITRESMPNHINSARNALLMYIYKTGKTQFINGKYIFISGSPVLDQAGGILTGRLSGIVNHHVPWYVKINQLPSYKTNCINDWEAKLDAIVTETISKRMTLISGIPPWVEMYFSRLLKTSGKSTIGEVFPNFSLYVHGGVNFKPYEHRFRELIGSNIDFFGNIPCLRGFLCISG